MAEQYERADTALAEIFDSLLRDVHTCLPGRVTAIDRASQTLSVQPCLQRKFMNQDPQDLPVIEDVPILFPGAGDMWLVFDIPVDSYVLLLFSERAIADWFEKGGTVDPLRRRKFSLSDAIAIPGLIPKPIQMSGGIPADKIALRSPDGTVKAELSTAGVFTVNSNADAAALSSQTDTVLGQLIDLLTTWVVAPNDGGAALKAAALAQWPLGSASMTSTASTNLKVDS